MTFSVLFQEYARRIRELRRANADVPEPALAPAFQRLLEQIIPQIPVAPKLVVTPEYLKPGVGRPDIALVRTGAPARAFVELKAPSKPSDPTRWRGQDKLQFERFQNLRNWATCNFVEIRLFRHDEELGSANLIPEAALRPDQSDARADKLIAAHDADPALRLLELLAVGAGQEPIARDAQHLAQLMAHSARLVRGVVRDRLAELPRDNDSHPLLQVRKEFRDVLYAHPEAAGYSASDFDELFSAAFAQTLAFGLLLVREATGKPVSSDAWRHMPEEHPLMRTALRVLSQEEVVQEIGVAHEVMRDTVNSFSPEILSFEPGGRDPILYFYEDFLQTFDPEARERYGVYYTPLEVVRFMVGALDRALRENLGTQGLRDPKVTILDPATGTGTFLLGIAERIREQTIAEAGKGMAALALRDLAERMFGFELLVGPYAVAHYRLHHALATGQNTGVELPRLGVFLTDTLAEPGAAAPLGSLGFVSEGITAERREANRIKSEQPILAIIGNPPYRRLEEGENRTLVGQWMDRLWDDLKEPVRAAGYGGQLNTFPELSVAFWRWAIWKMFQAPNAPKRGVVAFITNRTFMTGWPYAGLRKMMRQYFDRIEIIDLRGDIRRGERAGVTNDQGVFNVQVGTAITLAIASGAKTSTASADLHYFDSWAEYLYTRQAKLNWLTQGADEGKLANPVVVDRGPLDDMRPKPFQNGEWINLRELFKFSRSGMKSGNDEVFTSVQRSLLQCQLTPILESHAYNPELEVPYSYRPLDRRYFYNDLRLLDRPGPAMQQVWGAKNVGLYAVPSGTGSGPAVWCHGLLPDYHAFRGSYGGYAFPLYDRRPEVNAPNISLSILASLGAAYGQPVSAEDVFDAILCLLSAKSYTLRFAEDLEDVFPHVPFPAELSTFNEAVRIGREIRAVETFARPPSQKYLPADRARVETEPLGAVASVELRDGAITLCSDGTGRITGIPQSVWSFAVSGYRVLPRWLEARVGIQADLSFARELRDICGRIAELIDLCDEADNVLESTLGATLTREALGFGDSETLGDGVINE